MNCLRWKHLRTAGSKEEEAVEAKVFWLMVAFLNRLDMRELWRPGVPQLKLRIYQFDRLISAKLPTVHAVSGLLKM